MAIFNLGVSNELPEAQLPIGYLKPIVGVFSNFQYQRTLRLYVLKATVENVLPATTMANIINNATIGISKQLNDIVTAAFTATAVVSFYGSLKVLNTNMLTDSNNVYLTNVADSYVCDVILYVKSI